MKILFISDNTVSSVIRQHMIAKRLFEYGYDTSLIGGDNISEDNILGFDVYCFIRPIAGVSNVINYIRSRQKHSFFVVDQDDCFDAIPTHHVAYNYLGKGNPYQAQATRDAFALANKVTVSTPQLRDYYSDYNPAVVPNGWDESNPRWTVQIPRNRIIIGWAGTITHKEDFKIALSAIRDILNKYPETGLIIGNDETIYSWFKDLPVERRLFCPMLTYDMYPHLIKTMDILLAPLANDTFNLFKSDIKLVEAGAAGIPFVASPLPNYNAWGGGGILASSTSDFYDALDNLLKDTALQEKYSTAGRELSRGRTSMRITRDYWMPILQEAGTWLS